MKTISTLCIVLCGTVLLPFAYDKVLTPRHLIWCVITLVLVLFAKNLRLGKIHLLVFGYLCFALISGIFAENRSEWTYWVLRICVMLTFLATAEFNKRSLTKTMILLGLVFTAWFWIEYLYTDVLMGSCGLMWQKNFWAGAHFFVIPFCYYAIKQKFWQYAAIFVLAMMVLNIILINSRSATFAVCLALLIQSFKYRKTAIVIGLILAGALIMNGKMLLHTENLHLRYKVWKPTMSMIKENPMGVGVGNWAIEFPKYAAGMEYFPKQSGKRVFRDEVFRWPHNDFLWVLSEVGWLGFGFYLSIFIYAIHCARGTPWLIGITGYMAMAMFSAPRERPFASIMLVVFLLLVCPRKSVSMPRLSSVLLVAMTFSMVVYGYRFRSSCWERLVRDKNDNVWVVNNCRGYSVFSTMTFNMIPWKYWVAKANFEVGSRRVAHDMFIRAYGDNPNCIRSLTGMGLAWGLEKEYEKAIPYFEEALRICPDYEIAEEYLAVANKAASNK